MLNHTFRRSALEQNRFSPSPVRRERTTTTTPPSSARTRGCSVAADIRTPLTILPSHHGVIYARLLARSTICRAPTTAEIDVLVRPLHTHMKTTTTIIHPPLAAMSPQAHYPSPDSHSSHPIPGARISSPLVARRSFRFMSLSGDHAFGRAATRRCRVVAARDAATRGECGRPQREAAWRPPLRRARSVRSNAACAQP